MVIFELSCVDHHPEIIVPSELIKLLQVFPFPNNHKTTLENGNRKRNPFVNFLTNILLREANLMLLLVIS